ncbi:histidine triad nucleotide-binding protein [Francisella tularensis subsp. novicida]|uniref:histidine triad nucleotide-binding protein n=1 Tax=Francisella tularensis TaxID=263 RepID=UPI0005082E43|nr:histidine triad nucleotide-binding protein [Francisella tularensis]AJJ46609.1 HIT domain protein [Francisella tularensis subsp. novicida]APC95814.1 HIT domain protein [Francisella tularensis subsp. novicida]KFJ69626.1 HIT domain protein [Francisella tularensis subsp. novicida]MBK2344988.1 histidine triad nucleotide-binding protein [Francisella tularensis subsp. novicida]MBK2345335.1 histidine triad nucleotide-binding protein [Francisella tularensis subsp. novicida]
MSDCIFCKIITGEIPSKKVYEDENIFAFHDINPAADVHILVIPKKHIASLNDLTEHDQELMGKFILSIPKVAKLMGLKGFKTIFNTGKEGGQMVFHLHAHILGGKIRAKLPE